MAQTLTEEQLEKFRETGILVVEEVFGESEVAQARMGLHESLRTYGVDHGDLVSTGHNLRKMSSTSGAGGVLDLFYADWKFELSQNPKLFSVLSQLWAATYACPASHPDGRFDHPHGDFNPQEGLYYIDRVGYRVPEAISQLHATGKNRSKPLQRSLTPHLDCCANNLYGNSSKIEEKLRRWRPIQAFVALTPNLEANTGGYEAVPGFHREFNHHFSTHPSPAQEDRDRENGDPEIGRICIGEFSPLVPKVCVTHPHIISPTLTSFLGSSLMKKYWPNSSTLSTGWAAWSAGTGEHPTPTPSKT